jgi:hypothetical protein
MSRKRRRRTHAARGVEIHVGAQAAHTVLDGAATPRVVRSVARLWERLLHELTGTSRSAGYTLLLSSSREPDVFHETRRGEGRMASATSALTARQRVLLVFLRSDDGSELDPVRVMKGLFLLAQKTPSEWLPRSGTYDFEPYYYGPFSSAVYTDLESLHDTGLVECAPVPGRSWCTYSLTSHGASIAEETAKLLDHRLVDYAGRLRSWVSAQTFNDLLTRVYQEYPKYASKSVFRSRA